jgi:hypothetical protein
MHTGFCWEHLQKVTTQKTWASIGNGLDFLDGQRNCQVLKDSVPCSRSAFFIPGVSSHFSAPGGGGVGGLERCPRLFINNHIRIVRPSGI